MRKKLSSWLLRAAGIALAGFVAAAMAQPYPTKPIRLVLPFGPGGVADTTARIVAQKMTEQTGQQVLVDNRPGAGMITATEIAAKATPDGYTLLWLNNGHAVSVSLFKSLPYDPVKDFAPISTVGLFSIAVVVNPDSPIKSVGQLIALAKANPGKLNVGSVAIGSTQHLAAELFKASAGVDMLTIPFNNTGAVITAIRGNEVQVGFEILAPVVGQIKGGSLRAIAVTSPSRFPGLPDVPTVSESGLPDYSVSAWNGVAAPVKTPQPIVDWLNKAVNAAVAAPDVRQRLQGLGVEPLAGTPDAMRQLLASEIGKWGAVVEKAKIERQ